MSQAYDNLKAKGRPSFELNVSLENYNSLHASLPSCKTHSTVSAIHLLTGESAHLPPYPNVMQKKLTLPSPHPRLRTIPLASMAANELTELISQLPAPSPSQPSWAKDMRHYLRISSYHKIIIIYRACLSRHNAGSLSERRAMQRQCVLAAEAIIDELHHRSHSGPPSEEQAELPLLWTLPYHVLASCVVLSLDMIERHGENPEIERQRLTYVKKGQLALERLAGTSRIARRGLMVIEHLMKEKEVGRKRKKGSEDMADMVKRIRL